MPKNYIEIIKNQQKIINKLLEELEIKNSTKEIQIDDKFIDDVYKIMKKTKYKNGQVRGIKFISNELGTNEQSIRAAHEILKKRDLIITKNKKTYLK